VALIRLADGDSVQVDDEDAGWLEKLGPWKRSREGYVYRGSREGRDIQKMHLAIADHHDWFRKGRYIDHLKQNKLDMRKDQMRVVTPAESNKNRRSR
jgi:hypothetical protein